MGARTAAAGTRERKRRTMRTNTTHAKGLFALGLLVLLVTAVPATSETITQMKAGYDVWRTLGSGATAYSFEDDPLPKDFFCPGSELYKGRLEFEGQPIKTEPVGVLGNTDTVIERLDDAVFDKEGNARTRIRIKALHLEGTAKLSNACGDWRVEVGLDKTQPVSEMTLKREYSYGGTIHADLWINARLTFTHTKTGESVSTTRLLNLPTANQTSFACSDAAVNICGSPLPKNSLGLAKAGRLSVNIDYKPGDGEDNSFFEPIEDPDRCVIGCACNPDMGICLPVYSWHFNCFNPKPPIGSPQWFKCESHWTTPPCSIPEYAALLPECRPDGDGKILDAYRTQLDELHKMGIIHEDPDVVLDKQLGSEK